MIFSLNLFTICTENYRILTFMPSQSFFTCFSLFYFLAFFFTEETTYLDNGNHYIRHRNNRLSPLDAFEQQFSLILSSTTAGTNHATTRRHKIILRSVYWWSTNGQSWAIEDKFVMDRNNLETNHCFFLHAFKPK